MDVKNKETKEIIEFIHSYNECFYKKDIEKLKLFYDDKLIYFDNHKNNDTYNLNDHLNLLSDFFKNGKNTESGNVEPLIIENMNIFNKNNAACICFIAKYKSFPDPAIRCTYYIEKTNGKWKILHSHGSFQPDK